MPYRTPPMGYGRSGATPMPQGGMMQDMGNPRDRIAQALMNVQNPPPAMPMPPMTQMGGAPPPSPSMGGTPPSALPQAATGVPGTAMPSLGMPGMPPSGMGAPPMGQPMGMTPQPMGAPQPMMPGSGQQY